MGTITGDDALQSYETRNFDFEEDSGSTQLGQKNTGTDIRTKITQVERLGLGIIGVVLSVSYGTWDMQPATLLLMKFKFNSKDEENVPKKVEISMSFDLCKRKKESVPNKPPILRYFLPKIQAVNNNNFSLKGKSWSNPKRSEDHQVYWSITNGIPDELRLAVVVEHHSAYQGIVEVDIRKPSVLPYISVPWSRDDPLLFDGTTRKGHSPPRLDFDALTETDWNVFFHRSDHTNSFISEHPSQRTTKSATVPETADKLFRVRGIPHYCTREELAFALSSGTDFGKEAESISIQSFADNPYRREKVAIVSVKGRLPQFKKGITKDKWEISCKYASTDGARLMTLALVVDIHFRGFTVLGDFVKSPEHNVDIIAISGLAGHPLGSFKERGGQHVWLQNSLPLDLMKDNSSDIPKARILVYGYETRLKNSQSFQSMTDLAGQLQASLRAIRTDEDTKLPLIFIGHSLGGLIIKQALINMSDGVDADRANLKSTYGALFFGVPNRGMDIESLVPIVGDQPNRAFLESLGTNSDFLRAQAINFPRAFSFTDSHIFSFFETLKSPTARRDGEAWKMDGEPTVLVDIASATHSRPWELDSCFALAINRNHSEMVKFSRYDEDYERVLGYLKKLVQEAEGVIQKRFEISS